MKYIIFASMISLLSLNSFGLGQNAAHDIDCCSTGKCGAGIPQCPLKRDGLKREITSAKKNVNKAKSSNAVSE